MEKMELFLEIMQDIQRTLHHIAGVNESRHGPSRTPGCHPDCPHRTQTPTSTPVALQTPSIPLPSPSEEELMTVKQAYLEMNVSRSTIYVLRKLGKLTSLYSEKNVRLLRSEVEEAKKWYSLMKGKI